MFNVNRLINAIWLIFIVCFPVANVTVDAEPRSAATKLRIKRLVADLNADDFSSRQRAQERLVEIGLPVQEAVLKATYSKYREQRYRARLILKLIRQGALRPAFIEMGRRPDDRVDVEEGMWLISRILDPVVERAELSQQLDEMAAAVRKKLGSTTKPGDAAPREVVDAIRHVLGSQYKLNGSVANYDHPDNSSMHRVLKRRQGLPILLSHIAVAVADRLDVPVVGIGVPSRYMIKYDGARAPKGFDKKDIVVNPFDSWQVLSVDEVSTVVPAFNPASHLMPSPPRVTLSRMLTNLQSDFLVVGQPEMAAEVEMYQLMIDNSPQP